MELHARLFTLASIYIKGRMAQMGGDVLIKRERGRRRMRRRMRRKYIDILKSYNRGKGRCKGWLTTTTLYREGKNSYRKTPFTVFKNYTHNLYVQ